MTWGGEPSPSMPRTTSRRGKAGGLAWFRLDSTPANRAPKVVPPETVYASTATSATARAYDASTAGGPAAAASVVVVASETEARKDAGVCINVSGRLVKGGASARTLSASKTKGATRTTTPPRRERADAAHISDASGGGADSTSRGRQAPHTGVSERSSCCLCRVS